MKDYYQILEIAPSASQDAIKEQYRFLVQAWHPDKFPNPAQKLKAEEKLKEINAAYEILGNSAKRTEYDSRARYNTSSSHGQEYRERTAPRQSEDERRKKEEAARHAKEEQWKKERQNEQYKNRQQAIEKLEKQIKTIDSKISELKGLRELVVSDVSLITQIGTGSLFTLFYTIPLLLIVSVEYAFVIAAICAWLTTRAIVKDRRNKSQKTAIELQIKMDAMITKRQLLITQRNSL